MGMGITPQMLDKQLRPLLRPHGVEHWGVARYTDCLPLLPCRAAARIPPGVRSVLMVVLPYYTPLPAVGARRNVARYAALPDYHAVAGEILRRLVQALGALYPAEQFAAFVDNSPIREVAAAHLAGLGTVGCNGLLIHPQYGSRVFLGAVVTTLALPAAAPRAEPCLGCGACVAACPTGALALEGFCRERCRSHITQKKGDLTAWEQQQVRAGGLVWGCDLCLDACPLAGEIPTPIAALRERPEPCLTVQNLNRLRQDRPYGYRGKTVLLRNLTIIQQE